LHRSFYAIVSGLAQDPNYIHSLISTRMLEINRWILQEHNILEGNNLTKLGQKFLSQDLVPHIQKTLLYNRWTLLQGPARELYSDEGYYSYSASRLDPTILLKADFCLLHSVPGIAPQLLSVLPEPRKEYAKLVLQAKTYDELANSIITLKLTKNCFTSLYF
jgi:hypothetical protein